MSAFGANTTQPPPQHPATAAGTTGQTAPTTTGNAPRTADTVNDGSGGAQAANVMGDKIKGGWNVFHGAGEGIRGNINSFIDNAGEQIAGRGQGDVKPPTRTEEQRPAHVAANGADEMRSGLAHFQK